jgi:high affinity sulfate transporter 1
MAALAVWAMTVPQALAYAGIAGVPPIYGLYTVPLAMIAYAIFGTSRTLAVGPESAIAIISAVTVGALAINGGTEYLALTSALALMVAILFLLFGLLRMGWVANFLAQPVLQGFTQGIALTVIISQLPSVFGTGGSVANLGANLQNLPQLVGIDIDHTGFVLQLWLLLKTLGDVHLPTTVVGLASLALLFAFRQFRPQLPSALIAVTLAVLAVSFFGLVERDVSVIGEIQTGMVGLSIPAISLAQIGALLPGAFAIALLGYSVSLGVAGVGAQRTGETIDPNQELVGLGMANLGAAASSGFVVCGSLSRGSVIGRAGGQSQLVSLINAGLVLLTLLFLLPLFYKLPQATLSAVVITAMFGLLDFAYFRRLLRINRGEFSYAMAALFGVLLLGIMQGVGLGVLLALGVLIQRVSHPGTAVLGRLPGTQKYRDSTAYPDAASIPGLLIFRFDGPIIFPNARYFASEVQRRIDESATPITEVLIPSQQINLLDSTGAEVLAKLEFDLQSRGIAFAFAEVKSAVRETMARTGLDEAADTDRFYDSVEDGVQAFLTGHGSA